MLLTTLLWLHILAVIAWLGGIAYILFVLMPAVPKIALRDRANFMPVILPRFMRLVWLAIAVILTTGLYRIFVVYPVGEWTFWTTPLGRILGEKLTFVVLILGVVLSVTFRAVPRALAHVVTHKSDPADAYACKECATVVGSLKRHLQIGLMIGAGIVLWAVRLRG